MSRRPEGLLFIGRLAKHIRQTDLEEIFERYGPIDRCEVKYGAEMAYAFVDFEDRRDAEDAMRRENGRRLMGSAIIVEWARGNPRRPMMNNPSNSRRPQSHDECYKCHRTGHWARDCEERSYGGRGGGGGGGGAYESRSRRRSRSDSRDRSHSRDHRSRRRSRSRSPSYDGKRRRRSYSRSVSPARNGSRDVSKSRSRSVSRD